MAGFVDGHGVLLVGEQGVGGVPPAQQDAVPGGAEVGGGQGGPVVADGHDGGFVDQVGQIGAGEAGRAPGDDVEVDVAGQVLAGGVHGQDGSRSAWLGRGISTVRSKRPGRSRAGSRLSGRLVAAMRTTPVAGSKPSISASSWLRVCSRSSLPPKCPEPPAADGVDLVDEDDGRGLLAGVGEQVAHPGRADPDEHLHETGPGQGQERHPGLAGHGSGHQRLAGAGRADHEHAPGSDRAGVAVLVGVFEEVDHLGHFLFGPRVAGDVVEAGGGAVVEVVDAGLGAAHTGDAAGHGPASPADPHEEPDQQQQRQQVDEDPESGHARPGGAGHLHVVVLELGGQLVVGDGRGHLGGVPVAVGQGAAHVTVGGDGGRLDLVGVDVGHEVGETEVLVGRGPFGHGRPGEQGKRQHHTGDHQPDTPFRGAGRGARRDRIAGRAGLGRVGTMLVPVVHVVAFPSR